MGDRGNIAITSEQDGTVWFYTHWRGSEIPQILAAALDSPEARDRYDDAPYLRRIIFDALTDGDESGTGFGISTCVGDNGNPIAYVHADKRKVVFASRTRPPQTEEAWADGVDFEGFIAAIRSSV